MTRMKVADVSPLAVLPSDWRDALAPHVDASLLEALFARVEDERRRHVVLPPADATFAAFERTAWSRVRIVLLAQDPYHGDGQAEGLAFSVPRGVRAPPSLTNILTELTSDLGVRRPEHGSLHAWADRGMLLLNTALTVRAGEAGSHAKLGWTSFTSAVITALSRDHPRPLVFVAWGNPAKKAVAHIDRARHAVVDGVHPSPLSAHRGFLGSRPFSQIQTALQALGEAPFDFRL
jgi:uracil-DNA glycosylase